MAGISAAVQQQQYQHAPSKPQKAEPTPSRVMPEAVGQKRDQCRLAVALMIKRGKQAVADGAEQRKTAIAHTSSLGKARQQPACSGGANNPISVKHASSHAGHISLVRIGVCLWPGDNSSGDGRPGSAPHANGASNRLTTPGQPISLFPAADNRQRTDTPMPVHFNEPWSFTNSSSAADQRRQRAW